ncbi:MAG: FAD-dependent oxidoreductase [Candidatus Methylomirabilota bacterium]
MTSPEQAVDTLVVGAGIAGLSAAALLARAGRSVLLLERAARIGGVCQAVDTVAGRVELGGALLTGSGPDGPLAHLCERLDIPLTTVPCEPILQVATPRHRLSLFADPDRLWAEIRREFPPEEAGWRAFLFEMDVLAREQRNLTALLPPLPLVGMRARLAAWRVLGLGKLYGPRRQAIREVTQAERAPARAAMVRHGLGPESQRILDALLWYLALRDADECSTLEAAVTLHALREGSVTVRGGVAALVEGLAARFQEAGGTLRLDTEVTGGLAERGRMVGVTTAAGETIRARELLFTVSPEALAARFLPPRGGWRFREPLLRGPWEADSAAAAAVVVVPERYVPTELCDRCLVVPAADRPVRSGGVAILRSVPDPEPSSGPTPDRRFTICRVGPAGLPSEAADDEAALLALLDQVLPGAAAVRVRSQSFGAAALAGLWGRPQAVLRYSRVPPVGLGRRGFGRRLGWPGVCWIGEWTHPGRLVADVVEGATAAVDRSLEDG